MAFLQSPNIPEHVHPVTSCFKMVCALVSVCICPLIQNYSNYELLMLQTPLSNPKEMESPRPVQSDHFPSCLQQM